MVIPAALRERYGLVEGSQLITEELPEGILLRPAKVIPVEDQSWRERLFDEYDAAMRELRADPVAWAEEMAEQALWDATLADGLEDEPWEGGEQGAALTP